LKQAPGFHNAGYVEAQLRCSIKNSEDQFVRSGQRREAGRLLDAEEKEVQEEGTRGRESSSYFICCAPGQKDLISRLRLITQLERSWGLTRATPHARFARSLAECRTQAGGRSVSESTTCN